MTRNQAIFASTHEWFVAKVEKTPGEWSVVAIEEAVLPSGKVESKHVIHTDYHQMRDWAGY